MKNLLICFLLVLAACGSSGTKPDDIKACTVAHPFGFDTTIYFGQQVFADGHIESLCQAKDSTGKVVEENTGLGNCILGTADPLFGIDGIKYTIELHDAADPQNGEIIPFDSCKTTSSN